MMKKPSTKPTQRNITPLLNMATLLMTLLGTYYTGLTSWDYLHSPDFPLTQWSLSEPLTYTTAAEINEALWSDRHEPQFFTFDLIAAQNRISHLPWVAQAQITRQWPNKLSLKIKEHVPIGRWNDVRYVNEDGIVFAAPLRHRAQLADLHGEDKEAKYIASYYEQFRIKLNAIPLLIKSVTLTSQRTWLIILDNDTILYLGQRDVMARLERFIQAFPVLPDLKKVAYLDLRYDTGFAVGWRP